MKIEHEIKMNKKDFNILSSYFNVKPVAYPETFNKDEFTMFLDVFNGKKKVEEPETFNKDEFTMFLDVFNGKKKVEEN